MGFSKRRLIGHVLIVSCGCPIKAYEISKLFSSPIRERGSRGWEKMRMVDNRGTSWDIRKHIGDLGGKPNEFSRFHGIRPWEERQYLPYEYTDSNVPARCGNFNWR